jgi:hypothetical protein
VDDDLAFWEEVAFLKAVLELLFSLMRETDGGTPFMGEVYNSMYSLEKALNALVAPASDTKPAGEWSRQPYIDRMADITDPNDGIHIRRWNYLHCDYHSGGFAFNPKYRDIDVNGINNGEVQHDVELIINRFYRNDSSKARLARQQYNDFRQGRGLGGEAGAMEAAKTMPSWEWWFLYGGDMPELRHIACRVLSKCTSASAGERNWSAFEAVQHPKRCRLLHSTLNDLVFSRSNLRLQQKVTEKRGLLAAWEEEEVASAAHDAAVAAAQAAVAARYARVDTGGDSSGSESH